LAAIRDYVYKSFAVPKFMGKALASPKYLPLLFLLPIVLISILILITQDWNLNNLFPIKQGPFRYKEFIAHGPIEALFISGNILICFYFLGLQEILGKFKMQVEQASGIDFLASCLASSCRSDFASKVQELFNEQCKILGTFVYFLWFHWCNDFHRYCCD